MVNPRNIISQWFQIGYLSPTAFSLQRDKASLLLVVLRGTACRFLKFCADYEPRRSNVTWKIVIDAGQKMADVETELENPGSADVLVETRSIPPGALCPMAQ